MKFAIITHVQHIESVNQYFGYAPYVREMNIWFKYVDEVIIVAPLKIDNLTKIDAAYKHDNIDFIEVPDFSFNSFNARLKAVFKFPIIFRSVFYAMKKADHIHLRCPGNMGLIACLVQILFPNKSKTAKYAGNWDSNSKQPITYKAQKWILKNTFLTRNMKVLVYGGWENQSENIKPFFTATYSDSEKEIIEKTSLDTTIEFIFVGSLAPGKNPLYAIQLVHELVERGNSVVLSLYGEGSERNSLEKYIESNNLENEIVLHGNQDLEIVKKAYQKSHFVILPSKSEGWPKAIAEGMFWGCVPVASKVSCIPFMLDYGNRGVLLEMDFEKDVNQISEILKNQTLFLNKSNSAGKWSQNYTTDVFEAEIKKLFSK
ncbi:glycosyltransferase family 4 protein [Flavobacterium tructae]|uniref:Glycosyl transferase n=1 Tax=Flavobacterium tructae TaxID=1114873 RepID=A0A1S1J1X1_9FLAO|nr:glycosyltransferase [Flavobacterium tructae]OHT44592.1 glycosyl transferase [Flavobacterium tructae]OXB19270.1 glycosyl transferase [Flavobacterium tructae]